AIPAAAANRSTSRRRARGRRRGASRSAERAPATRPSALSSTVATMIDFSLDHFRLFGLPARYRIDAAALERAYRGVQGAVHPDRYAGAGDAQKRLALQASARANEAYRTLRDPIARAEYLLALRGVDATSE